MVKNRQGEIFEIGDEIEWEYHDAGQLYGKIKAIEGNLLYGHFQGSHYKGEYGSIHKNNARKRKGGVQMSKYQELKERIENVTEWDKEADDILMEIKGSHTVVMWQGGVERFGNYGVISIHKGTPINVEWKDEGALKWFGYESQCEKLEAFKQALFWLLDHSDIKRDVKVEQIERLEGKIEELQQEMKELKKGR